MNKQSFHHFSFWLLLLMSFSSNGQHVEDDIKASLEQYGKKLTIRANVPLLADYLEVRFYSDRNHSISSGTDVSPRHPRPEKQAAYMEKYQGNIWYPVVDILPDRGMEGVLQLNKSDTGYCLINGPFFKQREPISEKLILPPWKMYIWENAVFVNTKKVEAQGFYLRNSYPVPMHAFERTFNMLTEDWSGDIELIAILNGEVAASYKEHIDFTLTENLPQLEKGLSLDRERLFSALEATIGYLKNSQIKDSNHPSHKGLFMYYDLDADTYRTYNWSWWWGPAISLFLNSADRYPHIFPQAEMREIAGEVGEASLKFIWEDRNSELKGALVSSWKQNIRFNNGYAGSIIMADALFLAGWGWMPLYELTGEEKYLNATLAQCQITMELLDNRELIPHSYHIEDGEWYDWYLNEFGFGVEGFAGFI